MAVLDQLTLSNAVPKRDTSPAGRFRRRLVEAIDLQVAMAEAEATGAEFRRTRSRWMRNDAGVKELRDVPLRLRKWWWTDDAGTVHMSLRSGRRLLEMAPGKTSIEVGALADLSGKLAVLRDAVRAGELDRCMNQPSLEAPKKVEKGGEGTPKKAPRKPEEGARHGAP